MLFPRLPIWTLISTTFDGNGVAYVYLWFSKKWKIVYVGQTNDLKGTLGRAYGHVDINGTLRVRFEESVGEVLEKADDLTLVSYPLPQTPEYISLETSYREAIEYLVQKKLLEIRAAMSPAFRVISTVRSNDRVSSFTIKEYADAIVVDFQTKYERYY